MPDIVPDLIGVDSSHLPTSVVHRRSHSLGNLGQFGEIHPARPRGECAASSSRSGVVRSRSSASGASAQDAGYRGDRGCCRGDVPQAGLDGVFLPQENRDQHDQGNAGQRGNQHGGELAPASRAFPVLDLRQSEVRRQHIAAEALVEAAAAGIERAMIWRVSSVKC